MSQLYEECPECKRTYTQCPACDGKGFVATGITIGQVERIVAERDAAVRVALVWSEERGWHVGNPHCFERHQAQRLFAIREHLLASGDFTRGVESS